MPWQEESDNDSNLENVVDFSKKLKEAMPETRIEYLHGQDEACREKPYNG